GGGRGAGSGPPDPQNARRAWQPGGSKDWICRRKSIVSSYLEGGDKGDRTPDLVNAIHALSQLSYIPVLRSGFLLVGLGGVKPRGRLGRWVGPWVGRGLGGASRR